MQGLNPREVAAEVVAERLRKHGDAILLPFTVAHKYLARAEVNILYAQPQSFHQPKARAVKKAGHEARRAAEVHKQQEAS